MSEDEANEVLERLEAEVKTADADIEDLGIVNKTEYEETRDENESLKEENESLREEINEVKELYAEALADATSLDAEFFMDKDFESLKETYEETVDENLVETPEIKSGDTPEESEETKEASERQEEIFSELNEHFDDDLTKYTRTSEIEDVEDIREVLSMYEGRGGIWESAAEPYREALEELTAN